MEIRIVHIGDMSGAYGELIEEYCRRAGRYLTVTRTRVDKVSRNQPAEVKKKEADRLREEWIEREHRVGLDRRGKAVTSRQLARRINQWMVGAHSCVSFFIGGAHGLDSDFKNACDSRLSLSSLTLPHKLACLVLAEQLYRSLTIIKGESYHK